MENDGGDHELGADDLSSTDAVTITSFHGAKDDEEETDGPKGLSRSRNSMSKDDKRDRRIGREVRGSLSSSALEEAPTLDGTTFINSGVTSPTSCTSRRSSELGTSAEPQASSAREERFFSLDDTPVGDKNNEEVLGKGSDVGEGNCDASDLEAQLQRLWGRVPPPHDQGLALVRDALECRRELDGMLSKLAATENIKPSESGFQSVEWDLRPFSLSSFEARFSPALTDMIMLRQRSCERVRIVTPVGLSLGLTRRLFAREPLLPSEIEAEEEVQQDLKERESVPRTLLSQSRRARDPPPVVDSDSLLALVSPCPSNATAPETSPEEPVRYPSLPEVSSLIFCEDEEESEGESEDSINQEEGDERRANNAFPTSRSGRLRFCIQDLEGHVFDDSDAEDSDSEDAENSLDNEAFEEDLLETEKRLSTSDGPGDRHRSAQIGGDAGNDGAEDGSRLGGHSRPPGLRDGVDARKQRRREDVGDDGRVQRTRELDAVLRRLRSAVRRADGALRRTEARSMASAMIRVATLTTAKVSEAATTAAARKLLRGLGDRVRMERRTLRRRREGRWVTIYVGVRRWERDHYGLGFAVEVQEKYRLGWLRMSHDARVTGDRKHDEPPDGPRAGPGGRQSRRRVGFWGLGAAGRHEAKNQEDNEVDGWVGNLTCNYCEEHRMPGQRPKSTAFPTPATKPDEDDDPVEEGAFIDARETVDESESGSTQAAARWERGKDGRRRRAGVGADASGVGRTLVPEKPAGASPLPRRAVSRKAPTRRGDWCAAHVCLRWRPEGLRERKGKVHTVGDNNGNHGEEQGEQEEQEDVTRDSTHDAEREDRSHSAEENDSDGQGMNSSSATPGSDAREGLQDAGSPLSVVASRFGGGRGHRSAAAGCDVSSEWSSKSSEVFAWGDNGAGCLGISITKALASLSPVAVEPSGLLPAERVVAVASSERHSLLVTSMGSVYSAGEGMDGALGLGYMQDSDTFRLVEWFAEQMPPPRVHEASAGSDLIGCHSAAVDVEGRLFTWGVGAATGHSTLRPVLLPREVRMVEGTREDIDARSRDGRETDPRSRVRGVACGGGFTVAVTNGGKVFCWGSWARGRLGLGRPPEHTSGRKKRVLRFQATPRRMFGLGGSSVVQVAAGSWHGMVLTARGEVYAWGHNASGQVGIPMPQRLGQQHPPPEADKPRHVPAGLAPATRVSDMLRASWSPVRLPHFGGNHLHSPRAVHIACGAEHSMAVDCRGVAWTWGGQGRSCLGHGEAGLGAPRGGEGAAAEAQARAIATNNRTDMRTEKRSDHVPFIPLSREREVSRSRALRALAAGWAAPRAITSLAPPADPSGTTDNKTTAETLTSSETFGGVRVVAAAGGLHHTVLLTDEGRLFVFGEGAAVAGGDPVILDRIAGEGTTAKPRDAAERGIVRPIVSAATVDQDVVKPLLALSAVAGPTPVPKEACESWFPGLAARRVAAVACGGQHMIVVLAGDHIGYTLGMRFFRSAVGAQRLSPFDFDKHGGGGGGGSDSLEDGAEASGAEEHGDHEAWGPGRSGVDCELLVGGSYLHAHRVVLARRSPVLRDLIAQEERPGSGAHLQIFLPDIRFDVARALLEFLYTGDLRRPLGLDSPLPYDLRAAAKTYGVPRLEALCTEAISLGMDPRGRDRGKLASRDGRGWNQLVPPPSLASDLGGALGSMEHADVKFLAGGRPIYAHRAVLACQSEYFAAMFRFSTLDDDAWNLQDRDQMRDRDALGATPGGDSQQRGDGNPGIEDGDTVESETACEIVVPDSYRSFLRLLVFLYTGVLPESSAESVLEDLVAADRYRLLTMKRICQSMIRLSADNWLQVLQTADMVGAPLLREAALFFAQHNLPEVSQQEGFREMALGSSGYGLAQVLLPRLTATALGSSTLRYGGETVRRRREGRVAGDGRRVDKRDEEEDDDDPTFRPDSPFPWSAAATALGCGVAYYKMSNMIALGALVPIVNGLFFVCLVAFGFHKIREASSSEASSGRRRGRRGVFGSRGRGKGAWLGGFRRGGREGNRIGGTGRRKGRPRSTYLFG